MNEKLSSGGGGKAVSVPVHLDAYLRKCHRTPDSICLHGKECLLSQGRGVAKGDVVLMWSRLYSQGMIRTTEQDAEKALLRTSGRIPSSNLVISFPWKFVQYRIGDLPPILRYCSITLGALRDEINGPCAIHEIVGKNKEEIRELPSYSGKDQAL